MRNQVVSWTNLVVEVLEGKLCPGDLEPADYHFGCDRRHVFRDDGLIPYEAGWTSPRIEPIGDSYGVELESLDHCRRDRFVSLMELLQRAEAEGRIHWRCGNYPDLIETFPPETRVVYGRQVAEAHNWQAAYRW